MMYGAGNMWWSWGFGLLAIAGIALIVYVVVRLTSNKSGNALPPSTPGTPAPTTARVILDERFARGELSAEQYREQVRILGENR